MKVEELQNQLNFLVASNMIDKDDEVILLGSGEIKSMILNGGTCIPKIKEITIDNTIKGQCGLGFVEKGGIELKSFDKRFNTSFEE